MAIPGYYAVRSDCENDAKRVAESFCRSIEEINIVKGQFKKCSLPEMRDDWPAKIVVFQSAKNEVKLTLGYAGLLTFYRSGRNVYNFMLSSKNRGNRPKNGRLSSANSGLLVG
jgi:hypothetical protein